MINTDPSPSLVAGLAGLLMPITPADVLYREAGESPLVRSIGTFTTFAAGGFVFGASAEAFQIFAGNKKSVSQIVKAGALTGVKLGLEMGVTELVETSLAVYRGRQSNYDRIIAGAVAGGVCSLPNGPKAAVKGMASGAAVASALVCLRQISEWMT